MWLHLDWQMENERMSVRLGVETKACITLLDWLRAGDCARTLDNIVLLHRNMERRRAVSSLIKSINMPTIPDVGLHVECGSVTVFEIPLRARGRRPTDRLNRSLSKADSTQKVH